ncbi:hypothetical protein RRG08_014301 [Elysia crispata]|uniref:Peptidylglycine monooxygenase n=1 Tax=Elysia crispata TaxID=231223 RepID=A0AAE0Z297_9GAST|nr:hypothetical protein RRG08_014301 [Elysia crispata]
MIGESSYFKFRTKLVTLAFAIIVSVTASVTAVTDGSQECEATKEQDVMYFDVKLPRTTVPGQVTSYVCQTQPIPMTSQHEYHAVAFEPLIDNRDLVHHMLLFGCGETHDTPMQQAQARTPHLCGASDNSCRFFLVQWSMGIEGQICSPPNAGVRFGLKSVSRLSLQIHWNNANSTQGISDSSGFRIYYTKRLRKYDVANLQIGQNDLEIPPGQGHYAQTGGCSGECTSQWLQQPIFLTRAHVHMHYIGDGSVLELVRDGHVVKEIVRDNSYEYTKPPAHVLDEPVKVLPGDELRLTCIFNTRDGEKQRNRTIYWGEGSDGEMCYAFITYYPKVKDFNQCIQFDNYDICTETGFAPLGECVYPGFLHAFEMGMASAILEQCGKVESSSNGDNLTGRLCSAACSDAIQEVTGHPCMQGRVGQNARRTLLPDLVDWAAVKEILDQAETHCPHQ